MKNFSHYSEISKRRQCQPRVFTYLLFVSISAKLVNDALAFPLQEPLFSDARSESVSALQLGW